MPPSLNVIALISGGKDSFYSLLHCLQNGHKIIALANLYPAPAATLSEEAKENNDDGDDINSFMYQTVGHRIIPLYAGALDLPLYRQQISGSAIQAGRYYDSSQAEGSLDETEDLVPLLKRVIHDHPEANAVCSGAILSTYQRSRIESVALRLGLTPLAFLWQYPALPPTVSRPDSLTGLLEDMKAAGCDSRVIKIASGGMQQSLLWSNVTDLPTSSRILSGMAPFFQGDEFGLRGAVLGEGGEYETLAIDGPRSVWKKRIEIEYSKNLVTSQEGGVMALKLGPAKVVEKDEDTQGSLETDLVRIPGRFDLQFSGIAANLASQNSQCTKQDVPLSLPVLPKSNVDGEQAFISNDHTDTPHDPTEWSLPKLPPSDPLELKPSINLCRKSAILTISNITASECHGGPAHQASHIIALLKTIIHSKSIENKITPPLSPSDIIFTTILLESMSSFSSINTEYSKLFVAGTPNPPSRVTVSCGSSLPSNTSISLSVIIALKPVAEPQSPPQPPRRALHVQSRSYWAPANIGPYSQATCTSTPAATSGTEFVHLAGQIPLDPATMEVFNGPFVEQAILGLQHLWRVGQERDVDCWTWGVAFLPRLRGTESDRRKRAAVVAGVWNEAHCTNAQGKRLGWGNPAEETAVDGDSDNDSQDQSLILDAWDLRHNRSERGPLIPTAGAHLHILPNRHVFIDPTGQPWVPPILVAEVEELPRGAPVEWHSFGLGSLPKYPTARRRVQVVERMYDWGRVDVCSLLNEKNDNDSEEKEEDDEENGNETFQEHDHHHKEQKIDHHFITLLVTKAYKTAEKDGHIQIPSLQQLLPEVLGYRSSEVELLVVQGSAYLSRAEGRGTFASLGGDEAMPGTTVIPSRRLWALACWEGAPRRNDDAAAAENDADDGDDDVAAMPGRLSLALTLRVDAVGKREGLHD